VKKKLFLIAFFCVSTVIGCVALLNYPNLLFEAGENAFWNFARCVLFATMASVILTGIALFVTQRKLLNPYFQKFLKYRPLLFQLVRRDFLAKYKRSVLGVLWSLLNPLFTMLVMTIVFSFVFRFEIENFPVYLLSGQIIFTMFSEATNLCMGSVISAAPLIKKVSVPKYIFPISRALSSLINFVFSFVALILVMLITKAPFHLSMIYCVIPVLYVFIFSTGVGLILSSAVIFFRDITYLYGIFLTAITYFTPLFYPISIIPDHFRWIISLNPLYHMVECFRTCAIYGGIPTLWQNLVCLTIAVLSLGIGLFVFIRKQDRFILYI